MAGLNDTGKNAALKSGTGGVVSVMTHASLHSADPGTAGTSEISGGSPAYARKAVTWGTAATGIISDTGTDPAFDVGTGTTITHVGFWSAVTGGTFAGSIALSSSETYGAQGTYTLTQIRWQI